MLKKLTILLAVLVIPVVSGASQSADINRFLQSLEKALKDENLAAIQSSFDEDFLNHTNRLDFFRRLFNYCDDIDATIELLEHKQYPGAEEIKIHGEITAVPLNETSRRKIIDDEEVYWLERRDGGFFVLGVHSEGKNKALRNIFESQLKSQILQMLKNVENAVGTGNVDSALNFFHPEYFHDGQNLKSLKAALEKSLTAESRVIFNEVRMNERSAAPGGWPNSLWVDVSVSWEGTECSSGTPGLIKSGRTTLRFDRTDDGWKIAGNREPSPERIGKLRIKIPGESIAVPAVLGLVFLAGAALSFRRKGFLVIPAAAVAAGVVFFSVAGDDRPNVVIITVDTLRFDHVSAYKSSVPVKTPAMDGLAERGILFERAYCPIPTTGPSHASLFTSLYPRRHTVLRNGWKLPDELLTLAEILEKEGYTTGAFVSAATAGSDVGFGQGFQYFEDDIKNGFRSAGETVRAFASWFESNARRPFFVWIHLFDPHRPLVPPEPFLSEWGDGSFKGLYRAEVAYADSRLRMIFSALKVAGVDENTIIILTADHGQSLGEHQYWGHGNQLYDVTTRIPLIIKLPENLRVERNIIGPSSRVKTRVRLIDIYPTVLDLLSLPIPEGLDGSSLLPLMKGTGDRNDRDAYLDSRERERYLPPFQKDGLISGHWKLIRYEWAEAELYNLSEDPWELNNAADSYPEIQKRLSGKLEKWRNQTGPSAHLRETNITPEMRRKLRALGYVY